MQQALQTLIYTATEPRTVQPADNAGPISAERSGFRFSELMHAPASGLSAPSTEAHKLPVAGMPLPSAGKPLPATGDLLAASNSTGVLSAEISNTLDETDPSPPIARPDGEADAPYALPLAADALRNTSIGKPEAVARGPVQDTAMAGAFTTAPQSAVSTAAPNLFDQIRNPAEVSARSQTMPYNPLQLSPVPAASARDEAPGRRGNPRAVLPPAGLGDSASSGQRAASAPQSSVQSSPLLPLSSPDRAARRPRDQKVTVPPAGLRESAFSGPRPGSAPGSHLPVVDIADPQWQPQTPHKGTHAPFIQDPENKRLTDSQPVSGDDVAMPAMAKAHDNRADIGNRVLQELATPNMPAETQAAKPSPSLALPTVQAPIATVALSGASPTPSMSATAPAVTVVTVDTPVFDPAWADALQNRVLWLAGRNIQTAEIRLNPAELGPLQVQISVDDKLVDIAFRATQAATREALEIAMPRLKHMLAENGLSLAGASVSDHGIADQRDDANRSGAPDIGPSDEESIQAVSDLLPDRRTTKEPTGLVDTYV